MERILCFITGQRGRAGVLYAYIVAATSNIYAHALLEGRLFKTLASQYFTILLIAIYRPYLWA